MPSGSGLGLSIVRAIVVRHGGEVHASNAPGGGAVFTLILPSADRSARGQLRTERLIGEVGCRAQRNPAYVETRMPPELLALL